AGIASLTSEDRSREEWFRLRWMAVLAFAWVIGFLHTWARAGSSHEVLGLAAIEAAIVCAGYVALMHPGRAIHSRVGAPLGRVIAGRPGKALTAIVALAALALWAGSWRTAETARGEARRRGMNVILIVIDTLRADRPSFFAVDERPRDLTPNIRDLLARRGTVYTKAISQAPWTMPAVSSIMTGLYPDEHGAEQRDGTLPPDQLTVAEILREAGYRTVGASSVVLITKASGVVQGFESFDESQALDHTTISSRAITDKSIEFLRARSDEPFFLFAHYFDPHWAYRDHSEYDFADGYNGWLRDLMPEIRHNEFGEYVASVRPRPRRHLFDPDELSFLHDLYAEEIAYTDAEIGRLLGYVRESGLEENSLVILVADHGEEFLERGNLGHGRTVHQELIHVPLIIAEPASAGGETRPYPVETRALFTTVLEFLCVPPPPGRALPASLLSDRGSERSLVRSSTYTLVTAEAGRRFPEPVNLWWTSLQDGRWKLIKEHLRGRALLYDLSRDPGETRECSGEYPEQRNRLERHLDQLDVEAQSAAPTRPVPEADEEHQRRLKSLGYL
ncbi:MAG: sulfatase, partial [Armatimonadota bacterium]|nr:sulfatase [Armatimonadota bacterium]